MKIIDLKNLCYQYGSKEILKNINFCLNKGEHWIILGNNGSGKTTLAAIIAGYQGFNKGEYYYKDSRIEVKQNNQLREKIGFVSSSFFDKYLRYENGFNIVLGGYYGHLCEREISNDEVFSKGKKLLKAFEMHIRGMYPYNMLSKGQRQKILLCRGFMKDFEVLVLDEPCSGLDIVSRGQVLEALQYIAENGKSEIIYITHHADEILPFFTHVLLLKNGEIYMQGKKEHVITEKNISQFFGKKTICQWEKDGSVYFRINDRSIIDKILGEV